MNVIQSPKTYFVNDFFFSLQGEGARFGTPNLFVRFAGCNLRCAMEEGERSPGGFNCDTEFTSGVQMTMLEIVHRCLEIAPFCKNVIFTGGEPGLQVDELLLRGFKEAGFYTAIETNGTISLREFWYLKGNETKQADKQMLLDYVTVSPKVAEHAIQMTMANEVKYVRNYGQALPMTAVTADYHFISPAFEGDQMDMRSLSWCINLIKHNRTHTDWRLTMQMHKILNIR